MRRIVLIDGIRAHPWQFAGLMLAVALLFPSAFSVVSFMSAESPQAALASRNIGMPAHWTVGVFTGGGYYRWHTIAERPLLFISSCAALLGSLGYIAYLFVLAPGNAR